MINMLNSVQKFLSVKFKILVALEVIIVQQQIIPYFILYEDDQHLLRSIQKFISGKIKIIVSLQAIFVQKQIIPYFTSFQSRQLKKAIY